MRRCCLHAPSLRRVQGHERGLVALHKICVEGRNEEQKTGSPAKREESVINNSGGQQCAPSSTTTIATGAMHAPHCDAA